MRATLEEAGGIFIKLGHVSPVPRETMQPFVETQLQQPVDTVFSSLEWEPIAAASIAQVYRAHHAELGEVVVKVRRPGLEDTTSATPGRSGNSPD